MNLLLTFNPPPYGLFHLGWFVLTIIITVLCCYFFGRKHDEKIDKWFVFTIGVILLAGEIFKQIYYTVMEGHYAWHQFPLQFCSIPMYLAFISIFIKNKKVKESFYVFLGFFGLLAGIAVMAEPSGVFWYPYTPMVIHSCIWHSAMIIMGVYLIYSRNYGKNFKELFKGFIVYFITLVIAIIFNEVMYYALFKNMSSNIICNAFYISSHYISNLPILKDIQPAVPYPIFIVIYFLAFCIGVSLIWGIVKLIKIISKKNKKIAK